MLYFIVLAAFFTSFFIAIYFLPLLIQVAFKLNIIDVPNNTLKKHDKNTPYLGGLGIFIGFVFAVSLLLPFENNMFLFLAGCILLILIGLIDDIIALTPLNKLIGQILAVICFLKGGIYLKSNFFSNIFNIVISFFWLLTIINTFNLIDVMDGLCSLVALVASLSFLFFAIFQSNFQAAILLSAFAGAVLAFFLFNKPPAKIYMGDTGSLFLGGFLASIPLTVSWSDYNQFGFLIPIIILGIPLLELTSLILIRLYKKIPFFRGSRDHFSHYLIDKNYTKKHILAFVVACCLLFFFMTYFFYFNLINLQWLLFFGLIFTIFWWFFVIF